MRLDNRTNPVEFQGHRSKVKVIFIDLPKFTIFFIERGKIVVDNAVFLLLIV